VGTLAVSFNCGAGMQAQPACDSPITIPISAAELVDKITILRIKLSTIRDSSKLHNIQHELSLLEQAFKDYALDDDEVLGLMNALYVINKRMWDLEDAIRIKEAQQCFDQEFIAIARSVYATNDKRSLIKQRINQLVSSAIIEEKEYASYAAFDEQDGEGAGIRY
jgi:hypothetical protein